MGPGSLRAEHYHRDVVGPLLARRWPGMPYAAGRLGSGSDVLGLDDARSRDHDWGLRLTLLVDAEQVPAVAADLEQALPAGYAGLPTRFATTWDPVVRSRVEVASVEQFALSRLGLDACVPLSALDWLCLTGQSVLELTAGPVFRDDVGTLTALRRTLAWYPDDVWRYVVAADWARIGQDLPLMGRAGERGDDLGSRVLAARMVGTAMHLALLLARCWPPYPKWLGTALAGLPLGADLAPALAGVLAAADWRDRQRALGDALEVLRRAQRAAGLPVDPGAATEAFFDRPFLGVRQVMSALPPDGVTDPQLRALRPSVGAVEQWVDGVPLLTDAVRRVVAARAVLLSGGGKDWTG